MHITAADSIQLRETRPYFTDQQARIGAVFYAILFERSPGLRPMFPGDLFDLERKLASTLAIVIEGSSNWERLEPVLENLALRHLAYQVKPEDYDAVGAALMTALKHVGVTTEQYEAWKRVYVQISAHMIQTAYPD